MTTNLGSLDDLLNTMTGVTNTQKQQTGAIASAQGEQAQMGEQIAEMLFEVAERNKRVDAQKLGAQLEAQEQSRRVATAAGTNASASNEVVSSGMADLRSDFLAYNQASREAQVMEENGNLLANPFGWLNDVLNGPEVRATRDLTADRAAQSAQQLNNLHSLTQTNVKTQNAIAKTRTAATVKDQTEINARLNEAKALQAAQDAKQFTIAGISTLREFGSTEYNRRKDAYNMIVTQQRYEENRELRQQQLKLQQQQMEQQLGAQESYAELARVANLQLETMESKAKPITPAYMREHFNKNTVIGQRLQALVSSGMRSQDIGSAQLGSNAYESFQLMGSFGMKMPSNVDQGTVDTYEYTNNKLGEEIAEARGFLTATEDTEHGITSATVDDTATQADAFNSIFNSQIAKQDESFATDYPVQTAAIKEEVPAIETTPFYQTVVAPLEEAGASPDITTVAETTAQKYAEGELTSQQAVDGVTTLWRAQVDLFNATSGRDALGVPLLDVSPVKLLVGEPVAPSIGFKSTIMSDAEQIRQIGRTLNLKTGELYEEVDLTNSTDYGHYLTKYTSNVIARKMREGAVEQQGASSATGSFQRQGNTGSF
jgi:hypothetical protein